jgi:hypothetical protein
VRQPQVIPDEDHEVSYERVASVDVAKASGVVCMQTPDSSRPGRFVNRIWDGRRFEPRTNACTCRRRILLRHEPPFDARGRALFRRPFVRADQRWTACSAAAGGRGRVEDAPVGEGEQQHARYDRSEGRHDGP